MNLVICRKRDAGHQGQPGLDLEEVRYGQKCGARQHRRAAEASGVTAPGGGEQRRKKGVGSQPWGQKSTHGEGEEETPRELLLYLEGWGEGSVPRGFR